MAARQKKRYVCVPDINETLIDKKCFRLGVDALLKDELIDEKCCFGIQKQQVLFEYGHLGPDHTVFSSIATDYLAEGFHRCEASHTEIEKSIDNLVRSKKWKPPKFSKELIDFLHFCRYDCIGVTGLPEPIATAVGKSLHLDDVYGTCLEWDGSGIATGRVMWYMNKENHKAYCAREILAQYPGKPSITYGNGPEDPRIVDDSSSQFDIVLIASAKEDRTIINIPPTKKNQYWKRIDPEEDNLSTVREILDTYCLFYNHPLLDRVRSYVPPKRTQKASPRYLDRCSAKA